MDARKHFVGSLVVSISFMNSVESFRYEGRFLTNGWSHLSTNLDMGSVMLLQLDTMGRIPIGFLWIFLRKYNLDVRVFAGGLHNSNHVCLMNPLFLSKFSLFETLSFSFGVISSVRGLYTVLSFRCDIALLM